MDAEIDVHHEQEEKPVHALTKVGDALPGIGIVAAVLGIVITMQSIAGPVEEIGHHVAAALVDAGLPLLADTKAAVCACKFSAYSEFGALISIPVPAAPSGRRRSRRSPAGTTGARGPRRAAP